MRAQADPHFDPPAVGHRRSGTMEHLFRDRAWEIASSGDGTKVLEVGGGRSPMWDLEQCRGAGVDYWVNDVDSRELSLGPEWTGKILGNIANLDQAEVHKHAQTFDLIVSRFVLEHVDSPQSAYSAMLALLKPGGVALNMIPTLYASPFILNRLLPERTASRLLRTFAPRRNPGDIPKFPAFYRWTTSTRGTKMRLLDIGFSSVEIYPFFGHNYYERIPLLRGLVAKKGTWADTHDYRALSTYAIIACRA